MCDPGSADDRNPEISPGAKVYLRNCLAGQPGTVLRKERGRIVVDWGDLQLIGHHRAAALIPGEPSPHEN